MLLPQVYLVPHLPTLLMDEHRGHRTAMLEAFAGVREHMAQNPPEAVVVVSTHWQPSGPFLVDRGWHHGTITDYSGFGVEVLYDCPGDPALARTLVEQGQRAGVRVAAAERGVDHAVTVPLHFLLPRQEARVVPLSMSTRSHEECHRWGEVVAETLRLEPRRVGFLVSGSFAHDLHAWSLSREVPECVELDERLLGALQRGDWGEADRVDARLRERAKPEAGLRHLAMLRGFLGADIAGRLLAYERAPGVGSALMEFPLPLSVGEQASSSSPPSG